MRILVLSGQFHQTYSGPGTHTNNLINALVRDQHEVTLVAPSRQAPRQHQGYDVFPVPDPVFAHNHSRWISLSAHFRSAIRTLEQKWKFDVAHFSEGREILFVQMGIPSVGNVNDLYASETTGFFPSKQQYRDWFIRGIYFQISKRLEKRAFEKLDVLLVNSRHTAAQLAISNPGVSKKSHLCYKSVDAGFFSQSIKKRDVYLSRPKRILFIGGNMQRKGLDVLIRASKGVLEREPQAEFWIAGEDAATSSMRSISQELGVQKAIKFLGLCSKEQLLQIFAQVDLFCLPSYTEAFGVTLLEAMAAGVPVIGTNVGGIPEIIQDGESGILVPPGDPASLCSALTRLLGDADLWKKLHTRGQQTAGQFSVQRMMDCTYRAYDQAVQEKGKLVSV